MMEAINRRDPDAGYDALWLPGTGTRELDVQNWSSATGPPGDRGKGRSATP